MIKIIYRNFAEILLFFKQNSNTSRSHMKNLIEIAAADGQLDYVECDLLKRIAKRNSISIRQLKSIKANPAAVEFKVPEDKSERFYQLYDLVHMMIIDNEIHHKEQKLCNMFAVKFGYEREYIDEIIHAIKSNIENNNGHDNTMERLKWMLN